ncbi:YHS domain-containing (seleno)protein [Flavicella sp.]|uniref:YHS domain-containing (seleno)protein n=1 Tax=Flavicella sp. TaxID=2957742 RepID=UPI002611A714|nr:YHS domain-containing (seleno)protein [Flavicella sp.]MDG1803475.1 YHS domain-containing (seleno)protein [Flavicella sp.]
MKNIILFVFLLSTISIKAQKEINVDKKGFAADGYDVVAYFENSAVAGDKSYISIIDDVKYKFSTQDNLDKFNKDSKKYIPQYGGWCAYAIGAKNEKVEINPKTFEIRDGKLYLFYNSWGINTLKLWNEEGAEKLKAQADKNWDSY